MGDFNIDINSSNCDKDKLETFCDIVFNCTNIVHSETCFMKSSKSASVFFMIKKPLNSKELLPSKQTEDFSILLKNMHLRKMNFSGEVTHLL